MAKQKDFPITIKAGATAIKIYRSPLRVPVTSKPDGTGEDGQKIKFTAYDSFVVVYYQGGKRERKRFNSLEAARTEADRLKVLLLNQDLVELQITGQDLLVYQRAKAKADQLGISLDSLQMSSLKRGRFWEKPAFLKPPSFTIATARR